MISWEEDLGCQLKWAHSMDIKHSVRDETAAGCMLKEVNSCSQIKYVVHRLHDTMRCSAHPGNSHLMQQNRKNIVGAARRNRCGSFTKSTIANVIS